MAGAQPRGTRYSRGPGPWLHIRKQGAEHEHPPVAFRPLLVKRQFQIEGLSEHDPYVSQVWGRFEPRFQDLCEALLRPADVVLDIGANIGVTAHILSDFVPQGRVHAFEPGPDLFAMLQKNLQHNGVGNVTPVQCAVSDSPGTLQFLQDSAYGFLTHEGPAHMTHPVRITTVDDYVREQGLQRVDFIKIDVEGFEPQVMRGARETLLRFRPIVYFELNSWCLLAHGRNNPLDFLAYITADFHFVYRVVSASQPGPTRLLENMPVWHDSHGGSLVHDNMVMFKCANDLVVGNDEARLAAEVVRPLLLER